MREFIDRLMSNQRLLNIVGGVVVFALFAYAGYAVVRAGVAPAVAYWCLWPGCLLVVVAAAISDFWRDDRIDDLPVLLQAIARTYSLVAGGLIGALALYALMIVIVPVALIMAWLKPADPKDP